jgi:hypothetical protein
MITESASQFVFDAFKFAADNARREFGIVSICGWCDGARARTQTLVEQGHRVSHSICAACAARMEQEAE